MELWKIHNQTQQYIEVEQDHLMDLEPELLIPHEMFSDRDRSLHMIGVTTWVGQICCLTILNTIHKLNRPICGDF